MDRAQFLLVVSIVLFATGLSVWVLKERFGLQRLLGALVIVAGVIALRPS